MVLKILEYLDFKTLVRCSQLNKRFNAITRDSKLYRSLNLKPYWNYVNDTTLRYLQERCTHLERIDLSWSCDTKISSKVFIHFLCNRGGKLTHLRLNNCNFVDRNVIIEISMNCPHLKGTTEVKYRKSSIIIDWCFFFFFLRVVPSKLHPTHERRVSGPWELEMSRTPRIIQHQCLLDGFDKNNPK